MVGAVDLRLTAQAQRVAEGLLDAASALPRRVLVRAQHFKILLVARTQRLGARVRALIGLPRQPIGKEKLSLLVDTGADGALDLAHRLLGAKARAKVALQIFRHRRERILRQRKAIRRSHSRAFIFELLLLGLRPFDLSRFGKLLRLVRLPLGKNILVVAGREVARQDLAVQKRRKIDQRAGIGAGFAAPRDLFEQVEHLVKTRKVFQQPAILDRFRAGKPLCKVVNIEPAARAAAVLQQIAAQDLPRRLPRHRENAGALRHEVSAHRALKAQVRSRQQHVHIIGGVAIAAQP